MCRMIGFTIIKLMSFSKVLKSAPEHHGVIVNKPMLQETTQLASYYTPGEHSWGLICPMIWFANIGMMSFSTVPELAIGYSRSICRCCILICIVLHFWCKILNIDVSHDMVWADQILIPNWCPRNRFQRIQIWPERFRMSWNILMIYDSVINTAVLFDQCKLIMKMSQMTFR